MTDLNRRNFLKTGIALVAGVAAGSSSVLRAASPERKMTIDHVVPKKHKGPETWENLVAACVTCNARKGDRPPELAGMSLRRKPKRPNNVTFIRNFVGVADHRWKPYLFLD